MEAAIQCHCCLQRPPVHDLRTPYIRLGITESFSTMIEECFAMQLTLDRQCGICEECMFRLLDACHFKLQVQRCQETLRLQREYDEKISIKSESNLSDVSDEDSVLHEEVSVKSESDPLGDESDEDSTLMIPALESVLRDCWVRLERCDARAATHEPAETTDAPASDRQDTVPRQETELRQETVPRHETVRRQEIVPRQENVPRQETVPRHETVRRQGMVPQQETVRRQETILRQETVRRQGAVQRRETVSPVSLQEINTDIYRRTIVACVGSIRSEPDQQETVPQENRVVTNVNLCETCGVTFQQKYSVTPYVEEHMRIKLNKFQVLKLMFGNTSTIDKVERRKKPYTCKICKKKFATVASFKLHYLTHTGRKPFSCDICKRQFADKDSLKSYNVRHKLKLNSCEIYRKEFGQLSDLKAKRIRKADTYCCEICKEPFTEWSSLNRHMRIHKPYWCEICKKRFTRSDLFTKHKWTHMIDKLIKKL